MQSLLLAFKSNTNRLKMKQPKHHRKLNVFCKSYKWPRKNKTPKKKPSWTYNSKCSDKILNFNYDIVAYTFQPEDCRHLNLNKSISVFFSKNLIQVGNICAIFMKIRAVRHQKINLVRVSVHHYREWTEFQIFRFFCREREFRQYLLENYEMYSGSWVGNFLTPCFVLKIRTNGDLECLTYAILLVHNYYALTYLQYR